ncbi:dipeptidyl peptidase 1-like [Mya arenaria]|uniref:dipeptidyl peptidase 1-like n=1 Tax=Mya arenaria TaxID=6604 RepID=UPI0022E682D7|nr:dipeptidyl peptidase 1-like [Mya arenaria]
MEKLLWTTLLAAVLMFTVTGPVAADTPANCTFEDIRGTWGFSLTNISGDNSINCTVETKYTRTLKVTLDFPNFAIDEFGNTGTWTLIYNQGFEVTLGGRKYFAFSFYETRGKEILSECCNTFPGWVHSIDERNWDCMRGMKLNCDTAVKIQHVSEKVDAYRKRFGLNEDLVKAVNSNQSAWRATSRTVFAGMDRADVQRMAGGRLSARAYPRPAPVSDQYVKAARALPKQFDWRNKEGVNYVSPIRNQGNCGSCYAFGSMALYEARERIYTNNSVQKVYSTQDVVSCSEYSQGCDGGFPYLIAGKYGQDFGLVEESCFPYEGKDMPCQETTCPRTFTRDYYYVGGYYGACNEPQMRAELVNRGPIAVSFMVYNDFLHYKEGVYHHVSELDGKFNPWEITNHVVLVVGYGEEGGVPYWIVKNSWGPEWGEEGFFRIRRGNDECSIESMAVGIHPTV